MTPWLLDFGSDEICSQVIVNNYFSILNVALQCDFANYKSKAVWTKMRTIMSPFCCSFSLQAVAGLAADGRQIVTRAKSEANNYERFMFVL